MKLCGIAELAKRCGVSRQVVSNWAFRYGHFPKPIAVLATGKIFDGDEVWVWFQEHRKSPAFKRRLGRKRK